jgi:hypothetical protein
VYNSNIVNSTYNLIKGGFMATKDNEEKEYVSEDVPKYVPPNSKYDKTTLVTGQISAQKHKAMVVFGD